MRRAAAAVILVWGAAACGPRTPEAKFVSDVASALGGRAAVTGTRAVLLEGEGESYYLGENRNPDADQPVFRTRFRQTYDWTNSRFRKEELRLPMFPTGTAGLRQVITAFDTDLAFDVSPDGKATRLGDVAARERRGELRMHPIGLVQAALGDQATVSNLRTSPDGDSADIALADTPLLTLVVDPRTKLPSSISMPATHPILGDIVERMEFSSYQPVGGVMLPAKIAVQFDNLPVAHVQVLAQSTNFDASVPVPDAAYAAFAKNVRLEVPPILRASSSSAASAASSPVSAEEIAKGVWYLTGGAYYSVLVEFADHLTLIEAPVDDLRAQALLSKAKELRPDKPVTELVVTHHHFDHIGGVRAAVASGLALFVRGGSEAGAPSPEGARTTFARGSDAYFDELLRRPHTRVPDALGRAPQTPKLHAVGDYYQMKDPTRTMDLYAIAGSPYADTLLMAYLPKERLLVEADVYTPPAPGVRDTQTYPFAGNLVENIRNRHLDVDKIVPLHGQIVPLSALVSAAEARPAPAATPVMP